MIHLTNLDPTEPSRWPEQQARGRAAFLLRYGALALGLPITVLYDLLLLASRHDWALLVSTHHVVQLLLISVSVGPIAGLIVGRMLWRVGERRHGDAILAREFLTEHSTRSSNDAPVPS